MGPWPGPRSSPGARRGSASRSPRMLRAEGFDADARRPDERRRSRPRPPSSARTPVTADVAKEEDCRRIVDEHRERHGRLDVLVNSAGVGVAGAIDELETKTDRPPARTSTCAGRCSSRPPRCRFCARRSGLVVNIASIAGTGPSPQLPVYGAAKAGGDPVHEHAEPRPRSSTACARRRSAPASSIRR